MAIADVLLVFYFAGVINGERMRDQSATLKALSALLPVPEKPEELEAWLGLEASVQFLDANARSDSIILYAGVGHVFVHSVLVPKEKVERPDFEDLLHWHCDPFSTWSVFTSREEVGIAPPLSHPGAKTLQGAEQLVFLRTFHEVPEKGTYVEILQKLVHLAGLHYMPEREAWCRLTRHGDIEDAIRVVAVPDDSSSGSGRVILCARDVLAQYAALTDTTLVRLFDFTCIVERLFGGWRNITETKRTLGDAIAYRYGRHAGPASYARGAQIVPVAMSRQQAAAAAWGDDQSKQYVSFIAQDWKNQRIAEISCAPDALANYFTESDKPFEVTPAFFRPEVLLKYKSDTEKYALRPRSISCRGAWSLKTFDVNQEGQVHTYLIYLSHLPYEEQLHWRQYNEEPRGPISDRAFKTDFEGSSDEQYDPLRSLKRKLGDLDAASVGWWKSRGGEVFDRAHYTFTTSPDEWADELLHLDQLLVEGLQEKTLRALLVERGGSPDPKWRSLGLVEAFLVQVGFEPDHARAIMKPLRQLHELRSQVKGHATGSGAKTLRAEAIKEHGSLREHFRSLAQACDESIDVIVAAFAPAPVT